MHLIAGFPPGGIVDLMARLIGQWISNHLGQPFVIENRIGAGSNIAAEYVARAAPDGYTLLLSSSVNSWNTAIYNDLKFDFLRDLTPVAGIACLSGHGCHPNRSPGSRAQSRQWAAHRAAPPAGWRWSRQAAAAFRL